MTGTSMADLLQESGHVQRAGGVVLRRRHAAESRAGAHGDNGLGLARRARELFRKRFLAKHAGLRHFHRHGAFRNQDVSALADDFVDHFDRLVAGGGGQGLMKPQIEIMREQFDWFDGFGIQQRNGAAGTALALQPQYRRQSLR